MNNYDLLIQKLDAFVRKFYTNQLIRGLLIFFACLLIYILAIGTGEYFLYFPAWLKIIIVGILLIAGAVSLFVWIINPILKIQKLGKTISREQAAVIIGKHFPEVSDKLLNILQLKSNSTPTDSAELIEASIQQKASQLSVLPLTNAIDLKKNKKYLPLILPPAIILLLILLVSPSLLTEAGQRLMKPTTNFQPPAPFDFILENKNLKVPMFGNITIAAHTKGNKQPENMFIVIDGEQIEMERNAKNEFKYNINRLNRNTKFHFFAAGFNSPSYTIEIIEKPILEGFKIVLDYPKHTEKQKEILHSLSDLVLPEGTNVTWQITAIHTDNVTFQFANSSEKLLFQNNNNKQWNFSKKLMSDTAYTIHLHNTKTLLADSMQYNVTIIPDRHPTVQAAEIKDTISGQQVLLTGTAADDYGISKLYFHYNILDEQNNIIKAEKLPLPLNGKSVSTFEQYFDFGSIEILPNQKINYYIEVWDNDAVNGSKNAKSDIRTFGKLPKTALDSAMQYNNQQINEGLKTSASDAQKVQSDIKDLQTQLLQSQNIDWQKQQGMKAILEKQEQLKQKMEAIKKRLEEQRKQSEQKNYSEDIKNKQDELKKQMDNMLDKELADQLKKLQELMQQKNKENAFQNLQQVEQQNKLFQMNMERVQELIKKLELQMNVEDLANKLDELAKKESELNQKTEKQSLDNQQLKNEQESIRNELEKALNEDLKEIQKQNDQLQKPNKELDNAGEPGEQAKEDMQQSEDGLQNGDKNKASKAQQDAQKNLQKMAAAMKKMSSGMDMKQLDIDIKATRQILSNLLRYSFEQEALIASVKNTPMSSNAYIDNNIKQGKLSNNARMIKDSLFSLSKRVFDIAPSVNRETTELELNIKLATKAMEGRRISEVLVRQQHAMTNANNLALILNELLENLMQDMATQMKGSDGEPGDGSCSNPGGNTPKPSPGQSMKDIITGQQQLGEGLSKGKQGNGNGQNGEGKDGKQNAAGEYGDAEQLAKFAQQQAALRRQIQELSSMLNSMGINDNAKELKAIQDLMDRNETDLVNRRLTEQLLLRQKQILTKMLETEKAIREQEEDDKRVGNTGKNEQRPMPPELQQYLKQRAELLDAYKTSPPVLKPYFRKLNDNYLRQIKK